MSVRQWLDQHPRLDGYVCLASALLCGLVTLGSLDIDDPEAPFIGWGFGISAILLLVTAARRFRQARAAGGRGLG